MLYFLATDKLKLTGNDPGLLDAGGQLPIVPPLSEPATDAPLEAEQQDTYKHLVRILGICLASLMLVIGGYMAAKTYVASEMARLAKEGKAPSVALARAERAIVRVTHAGQFGFGLLPVFLLVVLGGVLEKYRLRSAAGISFGIAAVFFVANCFWLFRSRRGSWYTGGWFMVTAFFPAVLLAILSYLSAGAGYPSMRDAFVILAVLWILAAFVLRWITSTYQRAAKAVEDAINAPQRMIEDGVKQVTGVKDAMSQYVADATEYAGSQMEAAKAYVTEMVSGGSNELNAEEEEETGPQQATWWEWMTNIAERMGLNYSPNTQEEEKQDATEES